MIGREETRGTTRNTREGKIKERRKRGNENKRQERGKIELLRTKNESITNLLYTTLHFNGFGFPLILGCFLIVRRVESGN